MSREHARFTLRQLRYFVAVCEAGSIAAAAEREHVSASALSVAVADLERAVGSQLLVRRHAKGVVPSVLGREFEREARDLLARADELQYIGRAATGELTGRLSVGCLVTLAPLLAPSLNRRFAREHPRVAVELVDAGQDRLLAGLRGGRIDLAITYDLELGEDLDFAPLVELPPRAILAADGALARAPSLTLERLAREPLVLLDLPLSRGYFVELFRAKGLEPLIGGRSEHPEVIRSLVANGFGYSLVNVVPPLERALDGRPIRTVALRGTHRPMVLGVAWFSQPRLRPAAQAFLAVCRAAIPELASKKTMPSC